MKEPKQEIETLLALDGTAALAMPDRLAEPSVERLAEALATATRR